MPAFAVAVIGREAIDVFLRREDAYATLDEILADEPEEPFYVLPIELHEREASPS